MSEVLRHIYNRWDSAGRPRLRLVLRIAGVLDSAALVAFSVAGAMQKFDTPLEQWSYFGQVDIAALALTPLLLGEAVLGQMSRDRRSNDWGITIALLTAVMWPIVDSAMTPSSIRLDDAVARERLTIVFSSLFFMINAGRLAWMYLKSSMTKRLV